MKPLVATLLASALAATFSSAYAFNDKDIKNDATTYRTMTRQADADYKLAANKCTGMSGNERAVCVEEAKVVHARANADAVAQYHNTQKARETANITLANAEHALAVVKCSVLSGAEKDSCLANAKSVKVAAIADAKTDKQYRMAAAEQCAKMTNGQPDKACLIDNKERSTIAQKTEVAADAAVQKTKDAAAALADKTERVADRAGQATSNAATKTGKVVADSVITTKVKADLFREPELSSMAIHVETEKGVVMLSGFVDTRADADKAVQLARSVEGVTEVKSAIKVK
ncbi:MAG: BON domain-containing protein [Pseudomonadota bacterium]